jgi:DNA-binding response OmpR family regulator
MTRVALAARSAYHEQLVRGALDGLGFEIEVLPEDPSQAKKAIAETKVLLLQNPWRGGDSVRFLLDLKKDRATRSVPVLGIGGVERLDALRDAGVDQAVVVPSDLERLPALVQRFTRTNKLILHADDSEITRKVMREFLAGNGFAVAQAPDGQAAFEMALELAPDMVVTDVEMPRKTGWDLCKAIKAHPATANVPVIIVSSLRDGDNVEKGFESGANDYVTKPVDWNELLSTITKTFRGAELRGRRERILVVEDSDTYRQGVQQALAAQGFDVIQAKDGDEGIKKATDLLPDLIITDLEMPRLDGLQLFQYLRADAQTRSIPIMMMSASRSNTTKSDQANVTKMGFFDYLRKPFTSEKLLAIVERELARRRLDHLKHYVSDDAWDAAHSGSAPEEIRADEVGVSVLFSDICGFTPKCEKLTPRQIVELLNEYFDLLVPIVKKNNGSIDKFVGDCIMAVFHDVGGRNSAEDATRAGLEMQKALHEVFNKNKAEPFENRVGINSGVCVQGDIGSRHLRRDFTVIGDMVNIASRLEGAAEHGTTLVSQSTYERIKDKVEAIARPEPLKLKGKEQKVYAHKIVRFLDGK